MKLNALFLSVGASTLFLLSSCGGNKSTENQIASTTDEVEERSVETSEEIEEDFTSFKNEITDEKRST